MAQRPEYQPEGRAPNVLGDPRFLIVKGTRRNQENLLPPEVVERLKYRFKKQEEPNPPFWDGRGGI
jgi:hypothetical protein